jgi:hypothetical protein
VNDEGTGSNWNFIPSGPNRPDLGMSSFKSGFKRGEMDSPVKIQPHPFENSEYFGVSCDNAGLEILTLLDWLGVYK